MHLQSSHRIQARAGTTTTPTPDQQRVQVHLRDGEREFDIGTADVAVQHPQLKPLERAAIRNLVSAVAFYRTNLGRNGIDDAGLGVTFVLRAPYGPAVSPPMVMAVTTENPMSDVPSSRKGVLLPPDIAAFEYAQLVQLAESRERGFDSAVLVGLSDVGAALATRDWRIGENYFDRNGRVRALRDIANPRSRYALDPLTTDYRRVADSKPHLASGVASRTFYEVQQRLGWRRTEQLYAAVVKDQSLWQHGADFPALARSIDRQAQRLWPESAHARESVSRALRATHLSEAARPPG